MATIKHISSKNADYGAAEAYLTFEHDEFTMKPTLDEAGRLILREDYRIATLNCGEEDFAVACMRANLRYGKNQKREDVKSHHYIISFDPRDAADNGLTVDRAQALGEEFCAEHFPGHQAIVCTHPDGHNHSGNIHVHIVINSLRIAEVERKPYMDRVRHIIPVSNEKQITSFNPAGTGRNGTITIDDIMLHARLLSGALGVDLSMIGFADQLAGGLGEGGFFRVSAQAAERARIIRVALADFFDSIIDVHTFRKMGVIFPPTERPWQINFYGSISALEAEKQRTRADAMNSGLLLVQAIQALKEVGATKEIMSEFLEKTMMLDDPQAKLYAEIVDQKPAGEEDGFGGDFGDGGDGGSEEGAARPKLGKPNAEGEEG